MKKARHAAVVVSHGEIETVKTFASSDLAEAFAAGVEAGAGAMNDHGDVRTYLLDERGSLAASNAVLAAAIAAGWERGKE